MNKRGSLLALDWLNFFMADVETGIGPFVSAYLSAAHHFNPAQIGIVVGAQSFAQVLAQAPAGWLIDRTRRKKWLIAGATLVIAIGALLVVAAPNVLWQTVNQIAIGMAAAFVSPTVNAISLGLVGREAFPRRVGRNAAFSHGGNVTSALLAGLLGYTVGQQWIFYGSAMLGLVVLMTLSRIRQEEIDDDAARALPGEGGKQGELYSLPDVFRKTAIGLLAAFVVVFHFSNAAMLPLAGQELARAKQGASAIYMSACIVTAQAVMVPASYSVGRMADSVGRKPLFMTAFAVLIARGLLFALGHQPIYIVSVEALDGVGTAFASVLAVLIVSDLAKGTGRFNLMQGVIQASVGIGAFLGHFVAGFVAKAAGFPAAFSMLAAVAGAGLVSCFFFLPETKTNGR